MSTLRRGGVALCALACALALLLCAAPEPAWAAGPNWTYDPDKKTLTSNDEDKVELKNVSADDTNGLTVGGPSYDDQALDADFAGGLDLSGTVTGGDVSIAYTITAIGGRAFQGCSKLASVEIPASVTSIGDYAFRNCSELASVEIPDNVKSIGRYAFDGCSSLASVGLPSGLEKIGASAFEGCSSLKSVVIPCSVTEIGLKSYPAFRNCSSLMSIKVDEGNKFYSSECGVLFSADKKTLVCCPGGRAGKYVVPDGVTSIGNSAFDGCSSLESVVIPDGVTSIGSGAFFGCTSLGSVEIPASVTSIGGDAFRNCSKLASVEIPADVKLIGSDAFQDCNSLERVVVMAKTPPTLGTGVFKDCLGDMKVVVPAESLKTYKIGINWNLLANNLLAGYSLTVNDAALPGLYAEGDEVAAPADVVADAGQHVKWELSDDADRKETAYGKTIKLPALGGSNIYAACTAAPHAFSGWTPDAGGKTHTGTCACGMGATADHDFGDWKDHEDGTHAQTCTECGATETEPHTFSGRYCSVCGAEDPNYVPPVPTYRAEVSASEGGTASVSPAWARAGQEVTVTCSPDEGFEVRSVSVLDRDGGPVEVSDSGDGTWSFSMPSGGATVEVTFGCDGGALCPGRAFADVDTSQWYHDAVDAAVTSGLMTGYADGSGLFGVADPLTRAQAATVLWRALGDGAHAPACGMADVDPGAWYAGAVDWTVQSGLMGGYADGSGLFGVADPLTREQLATVLWRAAGSPDAGAFDSSAFSDGGEASAWAGPALAWAVSSGVLGGSDDGAGGMELRPTEAVTRAEVAAMVSRWLATE